MKFIRIEWIPLGKYYKVRDYDGREYIEIFDEKYWSLASI
jgi:hypothetical protein